MSNASLPPEAHTLKSFEREPFTVTPPNGMLGTAWLSAARYSAIQEQMEKRETGRSEDVILLQTFQT